MPFLSEELFLNVNKANWSNQKSVKLNRCILGVSFTCAENYTCQVAYLNQYVVRSASNSINHILFFSFII